MVSTLGTAGDTNQSPRTCPALIAHSPFMVHVCLPWKSPVHFTLEDILHLARANPHFYQLSRMPFKWQKKKHFTFWSNTMVRQNSKLYQGLYVQWPVYIIVPEVNWNIKSPQLRGNSWHWFGFQAFIVLFNSDYGTFNHIKAEPCISGLPNPPHPL